MVYVTSPAHDPALLGELQADCIYTRCPVLCDARDARANCCARCTARPSTQYLTSTPGFFGALPTTKRNPRRREGGGLLSCTTKRWCGEAGSLLLTPFSYHYEGHSRVMYPHTHHRRHPWQRHQLDLCPCLNPPPRPRWPQSRPRPRRRRSHPRQRTSPAHGRPPRPSSRLPRSMPEGGGLTLPLTTSIS